MKSLRSVFMDQDWRYYPTEDSDPVYGSSQSDESSWGIVSSISELPSVPGVLHLRHQFDLEPINDVCIRYWFHIDSSPEKTAIYINGWHVGTTQGVGELAADVTDYVSLEANVLLLKIIKKGGSGRIWLQPVRCDDAH